MKRLFVIAVLVTLIFSACQARTGNRVEPPPTGRLYLQITAPRDGWETSYGFVTVVGTVSHPRAKVSVNGIKVDVKKDGSFESDYILLSEGKNDLVAMATFDKQGDGETVRKTVTVNYVLKLGISISLNLEPGRDWFTESPAQIGGRVTDPRAEVIVNGRKAEVAKDGMISVILDLVEGKNQINATATLGDRSATDTREAIYVPPPPLVLSSTLPEDGSKTELDLVKVIGIISDPEAIVTVNNIRASVTAAGAFYTYIDLNEGENEINIVAVRGSDNTSRTVKVSYQPPAVAPSVTMDLKITSPQSDSNLRINLIPVTGTVSGLATIVLVNGREASVAADSTFRGYAVLNKGENVIKVIARNDNSKTVQNIKVVFEPPLVVLIEGPHRERGVDYTKEPASFTGRVNKPEAKVTVDGREVTVAPDGSFTARVFLSKSSTVTAVATMGDERDEQHVLTGIGENGAFLTVPGYSIFFRARLEHEHAITLKAGETKRLPLKLETRKDGPGEFNGSLVNVGQEYGKMPLTWPQGLDVYLEPAEFFAYPNAIYDFDLVFRTTRDLTAGTYYLNFDYAFENGFSGSSSIKVTVE